MREYDPSDYEEIKSWMEARRMPMPQPTELPKVGFIEEFTAVGFLIQTDTSCGLVDFYISNPEADAVKKLKAFNCITRNIIRHAKALGIKHLRCATQIRSIERIASEYGFQFSGSFRTMLRKV